MVPTARPAIAALIALLLLGVGAGIALADHVYSHRYVIVGRVIDNLGQPAYGWTASANFTGLPSGSFAGLCDGTAHPPGPQPDTNARGDFFLCYHVHDFVSASVTVSGQGFVRTFDLDPNLRKTFVHIRLETTWPTKDPTAVAEFHRRYDVRGRIWQAQPGASLEGVRVGGIASIGELVTVDMTSDAGRQPSSQATTNNYGDYGTVFSLGTNLTTGTVQVGSRGMRSDSVAVDRDFMVSDDDLRLPAEPNPLLQFLATYYWAILVPLALLIAAWYVPRRLGPRRTSRGVSRIPSVGWSKAQRLREAGVATIDRLAEADPEELATSTGFSTKEAKRLVRKAKEFLEAGSEGSKDKGAGED